MKKNLWFTLVVAVVAAGIYLMAGCGSSDSTAVNGYGRLQLGITDKQSDLFQNVVIAIKEVRGVPAGKENASDNDPGLPVIATFTTPRVIDVLTLRFQQQLLGDVTIPVGKYNQIRLVLEPNPNGQGQPPVNYLTLKSAPSVKIPLTTPSGQQSGLKVLGQFEVKTGVINAVLIDFDPNTAIVDRGNGDYNLKPTGIRIVQPSTALSSFGSMTGRVVSAIKDWGSATVSVVPQGEATPIAAGQVFSNFSSNRWEAPFSTFVPAGSYRLHIQATGFVHYSTPVKTVTAGNDVPLGDITISPLP
jgi:hypothetical protein